MTRIGHLSVIGTSSSIGGSRRRPSGELLGVQAAPKSDAATRRAEPVHPVPARMTTGHDYRGSEIVGIEEDDREAVSVRAPLPWTARHLHAAYRLGSPPEWDLVDEARRSSYRLFARRLGRRSSRDTGRSARIQTMCGREREARTLSGITTGRASEDEGRRCSTGASTVP